MACEIIDGIEMGIFTELTFKFELGVIAIALLFWLEKPAEKTEFSKAPEKVRSSAIKRAKIAVLRAFINLNPV